MIKLAENYSEKEERVIKETQQHIDNVKMFTSKLAEMLIERGVNHDKSKLESPEFETFVEYTDKLKTSTYGSDEYKQFLADMKPALDHHYSENPHHPECFSNGVDGMNIIDLIEMLCDWKAAGMRHSDGDLNKSIDYNKDRFSMSDQLVSIFRNSVELFK